MTVPNADGGDDARSRPAPVPARLPSLRDGLEAGDADRCWLIGSLLFGAACAAVFLAKAARLPVEAIPDDARQFLAWMGRFDDPSLLRGDLVADYWQSVTPWFHASLFRAAWLIGVGPLRFALVLPALLFPLAALFAYRFGRAIGVAPFAAFLVAAGYAVYAARNGTIPSATPRAFWPVLLPALLDGLARRSIAQSALAQLCLAGTYPQLTVVTATLIGLTSVDPSRRWRLDLSPRRLLLVGACAVATVAGILPFLFSTGAFAPVATLDEARRLPMFGAAGRNQVFEADGSIDLLCGFRLGLFPERCRGPADPRLWLLALLALAGPAALFARRLRRPTGPGPRSELPLLLLLVSLAWFAVAAAAMFRLHLPSRYATALVPLIVLTTVPVLLDVAAGSRPMVRLAESRIWRPGGDGWLAAGLALALVGAAIVPAKLRVPRDAALIGFLRGLPKQATVAGFADDLDFSPVLTGRSTLFSRELAIGYQLGYIRPILARMADIRDVVLTADPAVLAERLQRNRVDILVLDAETIDAARVPERFRSFFDADELGRLEAEARARGASALSRLAPACVAARFGTVAALDAACLRAGGVRMSD